MSMQANRHERENYDIEARWRGVLGVQEKSDIKAWAQKAKTWGKCELKLGKERSRLVVSFDRLKIENASREQIARIEEMLRSSGSPSDADSALALAELGQANARSAQGLLVNDYGRVLAKEWAVQSGASLQALLPAHCGLKVSFGKSLAD